MNKFVLLVGLFIGFFNSAFALTLEEAGKQKAIPCFACHGPTGNTNVSEWPKLAEQHKSYIAKQLLDFHAGKQSGRYNVTMTPNALPLTVDDIESLSVYFANLKGNFGATPKEFVLRGQALYRGGDKEKGIPACMACHGPAGLGLESAAYPRLAGQNVNYVIQQLKDFRAGVRHNDLNKMMTLAAKNLSDDDIIALANYIYGLHP